MLGERWLYFGREEVNVDRRKAHRILENYLRGKGVTEVNVLAITRSDIGSDWEFQLLEPYGVFFVREDGTVEDNYSVFEGNIINDGSN
jgi:hypothetical protein